MWTPPAVNAKIPMSEMALEIVLKHALLASERMKEANVWKYVHTQEKCGKAQWEGVSVRMNMLEIT